MSAEAVFGELPLGQLADNSFSIMKAPSQQDLLAEIQSLKDANLRLRHEVEYLRLNPSIARGMRGETLVADFVGGVRSKRGAGHDVLTTDGLQLIEVKYSSLLQAIGGRPVRRWVWTKLFGELGRKQYDRLLLVGESDSRFMDMYVDPTSPYVIFDIPYQNAIELAGGIKSGRYSQIQLTSNPSTVKSSRAKELFEVYQVPVWELRRRYSLRNY